MKILPTILLIMICLTPYSIAIVGIGQSVKAENNSITTTKTIPDKSGFDKKKCTFNNIPLRGKVKVVENFGDIKVKVVENFADLKVKVVTSFADDCGEWQFVEHFPDFTIQYVTSFPDLKISFIESFPGVN